MEVGSASMVAVLYSGRLIFVHDFVCLATRPRANFHCCKIVSTMLIATRPVFLNPSPPKMHLKWCFFCIVFSLDFSETLNFIVAEFHIFDHIGGFRVFGGGVEIEVVFPPWNIVVPVFISREKGLQTGGITTTYFFRMALFLLVCILKKVSFW